MKEGSESGESRGEEEAEERDAASTLHRRQTTSRRRRAPSTPCARPSCRFPAGAVPPPCLALNTDESPRRTPSHVPHRAGHTFSLMPTPVQEGVALRQGRRRRRGSHVHLHHDDVPFRNYAGRSFCTTTPSSALHQSPRPPCFLPRLALHRARRLVIMFEDPSCDDREDLRPEGRPQPLLLYDDYRADGDAFRLGDRLRHRR